MKTTELTRLISESIRKNLKEAYKPSTYIDGIEDIISDIQVQINKYETYAEQLRNEISVVRQLCASAALSIGYKFNIEAKLYNCSIEEHELSFNINVPIANFVEACKKDDYIMKLYQDEGGQTEQDLIECGLDYDFWQDDMYVGDKYHDFWFRAEKVQGNFVVCRGMLSSVFVNYD